MKPLILGLAAVLALSACQVRKAPDLDYTSFKESKPASILVVPPLNESPDVNGTWGMLASTAAPISEAGYYVFPAAVVEETFKENGLTNAADIHAVRPEKLHQIFGNDAVLYITVTEYGTSYQILDSVTTVSAKARLVDSRNGKRVVVGFGQHPRRQQQQQQRPVGGFGRRSGQSDCQQPDRPRLSGFQNRRIQPTVALFPQRYLERSEIRRRAAQISICRLNLSELQTAYANLDTCKPHRPKSGDRFQYPNKVRVLYFAEPEPFIQI